jgi:two-component system, cell cycle sensor histidine kinase and response regulator CckA
VTEQWTRPGIAEKRFRLEDLFRAVFERAADGVLLTDDDERILEVNDALCAMAGVGRDELIGRSAQILLAPPGYDATAARAQRQRTGTFRETVEFTGADGRRAWFECSLSASILPGIHMAIVRDVSDRVAEQRRFEDHLAQAGKMEAVARLAGGVAHDFNNILAAIRGFSVALLEDLRPEGQAADDLGEIISATDRAAALTRKLSSFSRSQLRSSEPVILDEVVAGMRDVLRGAIDPDVRYALRLGAGEAEVLADAVQVEQVLLNLVYNARDAMPRGGDLSIETSIVGEGGRRLVQLRVRDSGVGMDEPTRARAFDPFFTTRPVGDRAGLGLSTAYGIVTRAGGTISIESAPGEGSEVTIRLPLHEAAANEGVSAGAPHHTAETITTPIDVRDSAATTVLVVEDEALVRRLVCRILDKRGYRVISAKDGEEALDRCRALQGAVDIVLTDVVMPRMSGPEVARRVAEIFPGARVIFMSGYADHRVTDAETMDRAFALIEKPFSREALVELVERAVASGPGSETLP